MDLKGEYRIAAPREHVWALINDPQVLRDCIPGCESLDGSLEEGFSARVTTRVGPVKATFAGAVSLSNIKAPESYTISGEGKGGVAGFAKGGADVHLAEENGETILTYLAKAQVGGKLAQLGARLIDSTAKKLADEFFAGLAARAAPSGGRLTEAQLEIVAATVGAPESATSFAEPLAPPSQAGAHSAAAAAVQASPSVGRWPYVIVALAVVAIIVIAIASQ
ncbi:carbon monoxide dehydrogenase subunit G [Rhizobium sp. BK251]|uniref:SRPBCC family protein n=1 Tax=Rhizobium sp. BK251 TaxID=2512125 RepID=UPI00104615FC|nr:carbon monoxide dehydrogenase subunit G [Rhizobium sp. BK251]TCL71211.1 hypothetical protein EV286_106184 [Rhizobium sp. BK251]